MSNDIYGKYSAYLPQIMNHMAAEIRAYSEKEKARSGSMIYEHLLFRIKADQSMRSKCDKRNLPQTPRSALYDLHDAIGFRIVCRFIDDIYTNIEYIRKLPACRVVEEKNYVRHAKPNGYRSYHMILAVTVPYEDVLGQLPGTYFVEIQLRTLAMDSWASLEHEMKYKKNIKNPEMISRELKRCADELASCDLSMQTIRNLIKEEE